MALYFLALLPPYLGARVVFVSTLSEDGSANLGA